MVFELHIWGPAFGLPSIDAQCLAAVLFMRQSLGQKEWILIPSSDPHVSPLGELPALHDDGDVWIGGFANIVEYLQTVMHLNDCLDAQQRADCTAYSAFIASRGQPLLDLCFYVSSDNYQSCTSLALANILRWPDSWSVPHQLRAAAKRRSEHLGLSGLDVDTAEEEDKQHANAGLTAQIPRSLRKRKQTLTSLLGRSQQKNRFRLDAVTEEFFEPLSDMLAPDSMHILSRASNADCLAIAYVALMQISTLEHLWLHDALQSKYPRLDQWVRDRMDELIGPAVEASSIMHGNLQASKLPWRIPAPKPAKEYAQDAVAATIGAIPVIGTQFEAVEIKSSSSGTGVERLRKKQSHLGQLQRRRSLYLQVLASMLSISVGFSWMVYEGVLPLGLWNRSTRAPPRYGEAGAFLGLR
jgi:sorting and assembly machinery component 37